MGCGAEVTRDLPPRLVIKQEMPFPHLKIKRRSDSQLLIVFTLKIGKGR